MALLALRGFFRHQRVVAEPFFFQTKSVQLNISKIVCMVELNPFIPF